MSGDEDHSVQAAQLDRCPSPFSVGVPTATTVAQNSALGVSFGSPGGGSAASKLLRNVKEEVENEEEGGRKRKAKGGGKREKGPRLVETNKHLMKKGIVDLDSYSTTRSRGRRHDPGLTSTLPHSVTPRTHSPDVRRPVSHYGCAFVPEATQNRFNPGVLVAGAGGNMRVLENGASPNGGQPFQFPQDANEKYSSLCKWVEEPTRAAGEQAASPDSGYGNTPDNVRTERSDGGRRLAAKAKSQVHDDSSQYTSEGCSTCHNVNVTREQVYSDHGGSFSSEDLSLVQGAKFSFGSETDSGPQPPSPPSRTTYAAPATYLPTDGQTLLEDNRRVPQLFLPQSSSSHRAPETQRAQELPLSADTAHQYDPFSRQFAPSPGPTEGGQQCQFPSLNANTLGYDVNPLRTISSVPRLDRLHTQSREEVDYKAKHRKRVYQLNPTALHNERLQRSNARRQRSASQPMIAFPDSGQTVPGDHKDYFQVSDELSRENSHFALSEALLTVIEQYKANNTEEMQEMMKGERELQAVEEEPDGSIQVCSRFSPGSWGSASSTDDSVEGYSVRHVPKISLLELMQSPSDTNSAESTAQRLLQSIAAQFSSVDLDDMSVTQTVLTLPADFLTSLNKDEDLQKSVTTSATPIRGSREWAPPRAQIIFHIKHPPRNILKQLAAQGYRCTGCGMKQEPSQARHFRFCNYTGKYFCQKCHTNATSVIPAYIMDRWSFRKYYVSNFARDLLARIHYEPVFDVQDVNPQIYSRVPVLAQARDLRTQLIAVKKYLKTCRKAQSLSATFEGYLPWTADVHSYSINDFVQIRLKLRYLKSLLSDSIKHVNSCPLCQGKGFVCEFCSSPDIIYPFELDKVSTCSVCQCCFHKDCFKNQPCPRCIRMRQRERRRRMQFAEEDKPSAEHPT